MKLKNLKIIKILFILLSFKAILGVELEESSNSAKEKAIESCKNLASIAGEEASQFGKGLAKTFVKKSYEEFFEKPLFEYIKSCVKGGIEPYVDDPAKFTGKQKTLAGATLATLYLLYKWYISEKGQEPNKEKVAVDIRPKTFPLFILLLTEKDTGLALMSKFRYQLETIKKDLELNNKQGLELLPLLYPELISALEPSQRQYLNDLIKQVTGTDVIIAVPVKQ